jgi:SagB-type dehydrogenase family enzyme
VSAVSDARRHQTGRWLRLVYGSELALDDPAENYHEASKISPFQIGRQVEGARRLDASPELQLSSTRAVKRLGGQPLPLPPPRPLGGSLANAIGRRVSRRAFGEAAVLGDELSALLAAGYGVTHALEGEFQPGVLPLPLRAVPSGGALYPLELFVAALRVDGLDPGVYHFDPLGSVVETVRHGLEHGEVAELSTYPEIVAGCGALIVISAVFGRSRFKYGLRAYRFALLEAGHVGQNLLLAAAALGLAAVPLGGFYDRRADQFLGLDGVNESTLYMVAVGAPDGR